MDCQRKSGRVHGIFQLKCRKPAKLSEQISIHGVRTRDWTLQLQVSLLQTPNVWLTRCKSQTNFLVPLDSARAKIDVQSPTLIILGASY
ncbi:CSD domain-containing protein [Psidium guajava]|nr:CSD domain-containing protein [Psidium guajava]